MTVRDGTPEDRGYRDSESARGALRFALVVNALLSVLDLLSGIGVQVLLPTAGLGDVFFELMFHLHTPLLLLGVRLWQLSTRDRRDEKSSLRRAHKAVSQAITDAREQPAKAPAGPR